MIIRRGLIQAFSPTTYTASVLLFEATSNYLQGVPVSATLDGTSGLVGALCAVLFFDEHNPLDAVVLATFPNGSNGLPSPTPGRVTPVTGFQQIHNSLISAASTSTYTLVGVGGIPAGTLAVVYRVTFTSASAGASLNLAPHGATDITAYALCGNLPGAGASLSSEGLLPLSNSGQIDIRANGSSCTVNLYTYGYVI